MDHTIQPTGAMAIRLASKLACGYADHRTTVLIKGTVSATTHVAEVLLLYQGNLCGRITHGRGTPTGAVPLQGRGTDEMSHDFAFNLILPPGPVGRDVDFAIVARTDAGDEMQSDHQIIVDAEQPGWVTATGSDLDDADADAIRSPMMLYVERATLDAESDLSVAGWVISQAPLLAVQVFDGERRLGLAKSALPREDVGQHYTDYPNASAAGFVLNRSRVRIENDTITVQAIARSGNAFDVVVALTAAPPIVSPPPVEPAPEPAPLAPPIKTIPEPHPAPVPRIHLHCDEAALSSRGELLLSGWCASEDGIERLSVLFDGQEHEITDRSRARPDVGRIFPTIANARYAGFRLADTVADTAAGTYRIEILARSTTGEERRLDFLVDATITPDAADESADETTPIDSTLRIYIDTPSLDNDRVKAPVANRLTLEGWALARGGVAAIEILLDGQSAGEAYYGQRREDIAAAFPDWPGALLSGYVFSFPAPVMNRLKAGEHRIDVRLTTLDGKETTLTIRFVRSEKEQDLALFRERMPWREERLYADILAAMHWTPTFRVVLAPPLGPLVDADIAATLASLSAQRAAQWELLPLIAIPDAMTAALTIATNEGWTTGADTADHFLLVLRPGDILSGDALAELAIATGLHRDAEIVYSDEIRIDPGTGSTEPFLKPDWSPDLLLTTNYLGRLCCLRADLVSRANVGSDTLLIHGEYDVLLRCAEQARSVRHVPHVLCRRGPSGDEPEAVALASLARAADRRAIPAEVTAGPAPGHFHLRRTSTVVGRVSIIIPTIAAGGRVKTCIETIRRLTRRSGGDADVEIICIDNIRDRDSLWKSWLRENADVVVEILDDFNWSRFNNEGARRATGAFLLFLNDDVEVIDSTWLDALLEHASRREVGVVGALLLYPDRKVQHAGIFLSGQGRARHAFRFLGEGDPGYFGLALAEREVIAVTGACMLMRRECFDEIGGFDEAHSVVNNDLDFCLRLRAAGYRVIYQPYAKLIHHELASRAAMKDSYDVSAFEARWASVFAQGDPFFSPRLLKDHEDFQPDRELARVVLTGGAEIDRGSIRTVLAVKLDHIGDFVTALPAIRRLRALFPHARLCALTGRAALAFARAEPAIDEVIEFEFFHVRSGLGRKLLSDDDMRSLAEKLAPYRFDLAVDLRKSDDTRPVLQHTGARYTAGFDYDDRYPWLDISVDWEGDRKLRPKRRHVGTDLLRLIDAIDASCGTEMRTVLPMPPPSAFAGLDLPTAARRLFRKRVVCLHPGVGQETRQWPAAFFATLADMLIESCDVAIVLIGAPDEAALAAEVRGLMRRPRAAVSLAGKVALADLPALLTACSLYVGNNSGPKHIAAGLGVPTIGIHSGVVDATEWGPAGPAAVAIQRQMTCSPCYIWKLEECTRHFACMRQLDPAVVFEVCERMLVLGRPAA